MIKTIWCSGLALISGDKPDRRGITRSRPPVLPVSQRRPVNPAGHTHVLGDTQVPPLLQPSSQKARGKTEKSICSVWHHILDITAAAWKNTLQLKVKALQSGKCFHWEETHFFFHSHLLINCVLCFPVWSAMGQLDKILTQDLKWQYCATKIGQWPVAPLFKW